MLAMADRKGRIWASVPGLANRARVPVEDTEKALETFLAPDKYSRTPDHDGRRIEPIAGGWRLLNHAKYREMRDEVERAEQNRIAQATYRAKVSELADNKPPCTQAEAEAEAERSKAKGLGLTPPLCPHQEIIGLYAKHLPMGRQVKAPWAGERAKHLQARWRESNERQSLPWWDQFFEHCAKSHFLTGRTTPRWGKRPFEVSLDWIVSPTNFQKVIEGAYDD